MKNKFLTAALLLLSTYVGAQVTLTVYDDCNRNGHLVDLTDRSSGNAVDLGLSVRWASCNIGATAPEEYGDYFMWGETEPNERDYEWRNYKYCFNNSSTLTKYCTQAQYGTVDGKFTLESRDDAATVNWGSDWRTPTPEEWVELYEHCYWDRIKVNKIDVYQVTSKINGNSIIIPLTGYKTGSNIWSGYARYWTNSLQPSNAEEGEYNDNRALYYTLNTYLSRNYDYYDRYYGLPVRAVRP